MIPGIKMTHESYVVHWDILMPLVLHNRLTSVKEVATYCWMMCNVLVMKVLLRIVRTEDGIHITAVIVKMHQSSV